MNGVEESRQLERTERTRLFVRHALIVLGLVALGLLLWRIAHALLLAFGGVLFATFLRGLAGKLHQWTGVPMSWSLALVGLALVGLVALAGALIGPSIANQLGQLSDTLTQGVSQVRSYLEQTTWGKQLLQSATQGMQQGGNVLGAVAGMVARVADALLALVLVLFAGVYLAISPGVYTEGLVRLLPKSRQARGREVLGAVGRALWSWLLGQFVIMVAVGVLTAVGLLLIGVPLALALGLIAGLLEFIPFLGPILAAVPVILVALTVSPQMALYAALLFLAIQQIESNLLAPLVQREAVSLPPVLLLVAAIAFWLLFGVIGAILATPLLLVALVCVKMLYMHDVLGERVQLPGQAQAS